MPALDALAERLRLVLAPRGEEAGDIAGLQRLTGGANMETWSFDYHRDGDSEPLILRRQPGCGGEVGNLDLATEARLLTLAGERGVAVPTVRLLLQPQHELGAGYLMSRERGEALPNRLLGDERYQCARAGLAYQCGEALGHIHGIPPESLPQSLPDRSGERLFQHYQALLDQHGNPSPVLQLGLNWLRDNQRPQPRRALVHGDFRNGNLLVDEQGLVAVLDWELAHLGDPMEDLGYLSGNVWRFGREAPVGGFGDYGELFDGYQAVTGIRPDKDDIHYWQVHTALSWGSVCLLMADMYRSGSDPSLERAAVGRRLSEAEIDLLVLLEGKLP